MELLDFKVPAGEREIGLATVSDIHYGSPTCNIRGFKHWIWLIDKNHWPWISLADLTENALASSLGDVYRQRLSPQEQLDGIVELLEPIAPLCLGMIAGNHGKRSERVAGIELDKEIAHRLEAPYFGATLAGRIQFAAQGSPRRSGITNWLIMAHHLTGGGRTPGAKLNALMRMQETYGGMDLYLGGHIHASISNDDRRKEVVLSGGKPRARWRRRHFSACGSILDYDGSYAEDKMFPPSDLSQVVHFLGAKVEHRAGDKPDKWLKPYRRDVVPL